MSQPDEPLVILNPAAGSAHALDEGRLRAQLTASRLPSVWTETTPDRGADRIIRESPHRGAVIVLGGDGTVREAARALRGGDRPLAVVPLGTGNVMALRLDIPLTVPEALRVVREGVIRRTDLGICKGEPFLLTVGMGIDGLLVRESNRDRKRQMGKMAYLWSAARNMPVAHHRYQITLDGETVEEDGASVVVANFGTQVGPWIFPPDSDGGDGVLDVAVLKAATLEETVSLLAAPFRLKPREHRGLRLYRAKSVRVECERPVAQQIDGDYIGDASVVEASIEARSLPVMVSTRRPVLQWSREWPPRGLDWQPWSREEDPDRG